MKEAEYLPFRSRQLVGFSFVSFFDFIVEKSNQIHYATNTRQSPFLSRLQTNEYECSADVPRR